MAIPGMKVLKRARPATALDANTYKIKCLQCSGGSGDGKTTSACTIFGKKLLIDLDCRSESVADWSNVDIIKISEPNVKAPKAWDELVKLKEELWKATEEDIYPYDSIIVDGLTELFRLCMYWVQHMDPKKESFGIANSPGEQHWGPQMKHVADWIRSMIGLPTHLVVTSHEEIKEFRKTGETKWGPMSTGKLLIEIPKWFNETYFNVRQREKDDTIKFFWYTQAFGRHNYLKSSLNKMQKFWSDPILLDFDQEIVGYSALWKARFGVPGPILPNREEVK